MTDSTSDPRPSLLRIPTLPDLGHQAPAGNIEQLIEFIHGAQRLLVITGAGLSTASGIPAYRNQHGQWLRRTPIFYQDFIRCPTARRRYWARSYFGWQPVSKAKPNKGHLTLAKLEAQGRVHTLITQNVDGLHQRAGSQSVIELHGQLGRVKCLGCGQHYSRDAIQQKLVTLNAHWQPSIGTLNPDGDMDLDEAAYPDFSVVDCEQCQGPLKPDVVFFGESVPTETSQAITQALTECDRLLVIGSSLVVMSGYRLAKYAHQNNIPIAALNQGLTRADALLDFKVDQDCVVALNVVASTF